VDVLKTADPDIWQAIHREEIRRYTDFPDLRGRLQELGISCL
jgi:hypothetical protein